MNSDLNIVRLDKWLWSARFYKTRSIARNMVNGGKVQYNGKRTKPSKLVKVGDKITLKQGYEKKTIVILALSNQRRGATESKTLYSETRKSLETRESIAFQRKLCKFDKGFRPDKKQRRDAIKLKK
ncbi:S4 domain-containing protein [Candidatus Photodesmus anomalopis]|uniref:Heat shock protein 15 n=2 Tax=Candidatus Photodesmus anomalopis TaxID=28176 RepID=S3DIH7_9GAMM|nr:S4 domain-containing protein [Candidatus Photodesmus katoptron]EPE37525.1 heat shock protein 15 [Candidatus Photodesmus katoptron Akat1]